MSEFEALVREAVDDKLNGSLTNRAFTELVRRFQDLVFGYVYAKMRNRVLAEDITQDTFLTAYDKLERLRNPAAFPAWIRKIAARRCLAEFRAREPAPLPDERLEAIPSAYESPERAYETEEERSEVRQAIDRLPAAQRTSIVLYYIDGYSQDDIAEFLNLEPQTVKKRLQRGRDTMRREFMKKVRDDLAAMRPSGSDELVDRVALYASFESAAKLGQIAVLEQMLVDGVEVNRPDASGKTLLHWAVEREHLDAVVLLLRSGADRDLPDRAGRTPRAIAMRKKNPELRALFERPVRSAGSRKGASN
jgi:RNA polymerase sigma-70 factor (ECF subfamily)